MAANALIMRNLALNCKLVFLVAKSGAVAAMDDLSFTIVARRAEQ